jgi:drug/metabolite transporter (DMT)-like permease
MHAASRTLVCLAALGASPAAAFRTPMYPLAAILRLPAYVSSRARPLLYSELRADGAKDADPYVALAVVGADGMPAAKVTGDALGALVADLEAVAASPAALAGYVDAAQVDYLDSLNPVLRSNLARGAVLALTILWATNFPVIKAIFDTGIAPSDYAALRFSLAAAALLPMARWDDKKLLIGSMQCGAWVATGYVTQAIALTTASANKGAFICACQVIFVALVNALGTRTFVPRTWIAALLAVGGVGLLELAGPVKPELSDLWCLGMPICFGMGYVRLEALMEEHPRDARTVSAIKVAVVGAVALSWSAGRALLEPGGAHLLEALQSPTLPWPALLYTGLITTAGAILAESYAFKYVPATDAAVILATEPLWASLCAAYLIGEQLSSTDMAGGALVLAACVVNEIKFGGGGKNEGAAPGKGD